jgi:hypothetical protein
MPDLGREKDEERGVGERGGRRGGVRMTCEASPFFKLFFLTDMWQQFLLFFSKSNCTS